MKPPLAHTQRENRSFHRPTVAVCDASFGGCCARAVASLVKGLALAVLLIAISHPASASTAEAVKSADFACRDLHGNLRELVRRMQESSWQWLREPASLRQATAAPGDAQSIKPVPVPSDQQRLNRDFRLMTRANVNATATATNRRSNRIMTFSHDHPNDSSFVNLRVDESGNCLWCAAATSDDACGGVFNGTQLMDAPATTFETPFDYTRNSAPNVPEAILQIDVSGFGRAAVTQKLGSAFLESAGFAMLARPLG